MRDQQERPHVVGPLSFLLRPSLAKHFLATIQANVEGSWCPRFGLASKSFPGETKESHVRSLLMLEESRDENSTHPRVHVYCVQ